ncbi:peptidase family M41-domain-containing protein [Syncephalis pseudoplumigaleata]|uniref:Peptidase family M41-domain-containing protein n=1 Tax=Syncephalis pseudoplumigaleata TaxID=1712513 RepID=A0A4P9Z002_9FUNG|nr:peptidase family M41-domain-containing protein [Syncephalis pseudoplumigaleata]|eukprot:RKP25555.1 peptidase family M41-domain-containing protein [Syncephalis pseudoplumigaleata]
MQERRLERLEADAIAMPDDPVRQAAYYRELNRAGYPEMVVSRYEMGKFAADDACARLYIEALAKSGQMDKIWPSAKSLHDGTATTTTTTTTATGDTGTPMANLLQSALAGSGHKRAGSEGITGAVAGMTGMGGSGIKENPIHVVVDEPRGSRFWRAARSFGATFIYAFCMLTFVSLALENSGLLKSTPPQTEFEPSPERSVRFSDVQGVDEAKHELEELVAFLKDPSKFTELGGKLPKGVLLTGPPGTGKTLLARAVAGEAEVPFFFMSGSEFDEMYVGVGARRVRELFAAARRKAPSIVFIDELDAIGGKRNPKDQTYMKQTLNQLLVEMDGFSQTEGVIVMAATNFPELLDKALVRPGRFDRHVPVPLPDVRGRMQILTLHTKNILVAKDVNLSIVARGTPGFSGADLSNLVNIAAIQAAREGEREVTMRHFEFAKDRIIMGAERRSAVITDESKRVTAYHEGGHALVAYYTKGAIPLHKATIMPRGQALGMTIQLPEMDKDSYTKQEYLAMLDVCMGGRVAEEMIFGDENVTSGAHNDIMKATAVARRMVAQFGMSEKVGPVAYVDEDMPQLSTETKQTIEGEVRAFIENAKQRAETLLTTHRAELDRLAHALIENETLSREQIDIVLKGAGSSLPPIAEELEKTKPMPLAPVDAAAMPPSTAKEPRSAKEPAGIEAKGSAVNGKRPSSQPTPPPQPAAIPSR